MNNNWRGFEGQVVGNQYHIKNYLGEGGFGVVYEADDVVGDRLIRTIAIKLIPKISDNYDKQINELKFATQLSNDNLLRCYSSGQCNLHGTDYLYLIMELADETLETILKTKSLSEKEVLDLAKSIAKSLEYLHNHKDRLIHLDIKPSSILKIGAKWKLGDFTLVRALGAHKDTKTNDIKATIAYAPPENFQGTISPACDIWSYGILLCEVLTGQLPFEEDTNEKLMYAILQKPPRIKSNINDPFRKIIINCLEKNPDMRWSINRIIQALDEPISRPRNTKNIKISSPSVLFGHKNWVSSVSISKSGGIGISASLDHSIRLWNLKTKEETMCLKNQQGADSCVALNENHHVFYTAGTDKEIHILDLNTGEQISNLNCNFIVSKLWISSEANKLIASGSGNCAMVWNMDNYRKPIILIHTSEITSLAFQSSTENIAVGGKDGKVIIYKPKSDQYTSDTILNISNVPISIEGLSFSYYGELLGIAYTNKIAVYNIVNKQKIYQFKSDSILIRGINFIGENNLIMYQYNQDIIYIWDNDKSENVIQLLAPNSVQSVAVSGDGKYIFAGGRNKSLYLWSIE